MSSRIPGFYRLTPEARLDAVAERARLGPGERAAFQDAGLSLTRADAMIENVVGTFALPCGVAVNLRMNDEDRLVPMVVEEPSVVAAVSNMARIAREGGGIRAECDASVMIGQVQIIEPEPGAKARLEAEIPALMDACRGVHEELEARGGGIRGMEVRELRYDEPGEEPEDMIVLHFFLDCVDAMGANMVNTLAERLAPRVVKITGGTVGLRILSNLADRRLARAEVRILPEHLDPEDGQAMAEGIAAAWRFAWADPYRAATHNKGILNGVDAVALATGNDWRAIEAGAHAYAARNGQYRPLSSWKVVDGALVGRLEMPMQVGTVSGAIRVHPTVQANLKVAGVRSAADLSCLIAAVGLAQNLGALRALATEGIQQGHMRMHARTVAIGAGAEPSEVAAVVRALVASHTFTVERAREELDRLRAKR